MAVGREVLGRDCVDGSMASSDEFMMAFQEANTAWCWGYVWGRPYLNLKTRSLLNLAMLTALNRSKELRLHVRGALANDATPDQIREVLMQATIYCGIPACLDSFKSANEVLKREAALAGTKAAAE